MVSEKKPVVLFVYNRPQTTLRVLDAIRAYQPHKLLIVSDGAKPQEDDALRVAAVREVCEQVDWPCVVSRLYRSSNLGCRASVSSGLKWVFEQENDAIILEDDCLPDDSFFEYCAALLEQYESDPQIMSICGYRAEPLDPNESFSYFFSKYPSNWGWATWRRAFQGYDPDLLTWSEDKISWLAEHLGSQAFARYWAYLFKRSKKGANDWDYAWAYHCWRHHGLSIRPQVSLVENIGFGPDATHTKDAAHPYGFKASGVMTFPLAHPRKPILSIAKESLLEDLYYSGMRERQLRMFYQLINDSRKEQ